MRVPSASRLAYSAPPGSRATAGPTAPEGPREAFVPSPTETPRPSAGRRLGVGLMAALSMAGMAAGLVGCGEAPPPSGPQTSVSTDISYFVMSAEEEAALGKAVAARIEKETPLWNDAAANARVQSLAQRLVPDSSRQDVTYQFKLLDTEAVNAMATPGGNIYVTRGLMERFPEDRELLFILGHEMGHVEARHSVKQLGKGMLLDWAARAITRDEGKLARVVAAATEQVLNNRFSQADEHEADALGQGHLVGLGESPWHGVRAMERLRSLSDGEEPRIVRELFGSHPPSAERIAELRRGVEGYPEP